MSFLNASQPKSTILVTGGATGIGLVLSKRLVALGHTVVAAGRRQDALDSAKTAVPGLHTIQGDVGSDAGRIALHRAVLAAYPTLNVLINNAGVGGQLTPLKDFTQSDWEKEKSLIGINIEGPIHLSILFIPHLLQQPRALIANVSSVLAFVPYADLAVYSASKGNTHIDVVHVYVASLTNLYQLQLRFTRSP